MESTIVLKPEPCRELSRLGYEGAAIAEPSPQFEAIMWALERRVLLSPKEHGRGWHDGQRIWSYNAAIEQHREAFLGLLALLLRRGLCGSALQIGLGRYGGSHFALRQVCERVVTVEVNGEYVRHFEENNEISPSADALITGDSADPEVVAQVRSTANGCDVLFVDGDDTYDAVRSDWENYAPLVREGGLVAIVDSSQRVQEVRDPIGVDRFLCDLRGLLDREGISHFDIGHDVPILCYYVTSEVMQRVHRVEIDFPASRSGSGRVAPVLIEGNIENFSIYDYRGSFYAVRVENAPFSPHGIFRRQYEDLLWNGELAQLRRDIVSYVAAQPLLEQACDMLCAGRLVDGRQWVREIVATYPTLPAAMTEALNQSPYSSTVLARLGTIRALEGRVSEGRLLLDRALSFDPFNRSKLLALVGIIRYLDGDEVAAIEILREKSAILRRKEIEAVAFFSLDHHALWSEAKLLCEVRGALLVGATTEAEADGFDQLRIQHRAVTPAQLAAGVEPPFEAYNLLLIGDLETGAEVLRKASASLARIEYICVACRSSARSAAAASADEIAAQLARQGYLRWPNRDVFNPYPGEIIFSRA